MKLSNKIVLVTGGTSGVGLEAAKLFRKEGATVIIVGQNPGRLQSAASQLDLPVMQSAKFDFVINLKAAKALGLTVPPSLIALADEVVE